MYYTYIPQSLANPDRRYIGHARDLRQRLIDHNQGKCRHTAEFKPWKIIVYTAFETLELAKAFEHYLKSGSGHAFAHKHFGY